MNSSDIVNVLSKRFKRISKHCKALLKEFSVEEVHDFRVEIKRLRAFIRLLNAALPLENQLKITGKIKRFYNAVGKLRNLQLHQQRICALCQADFLEAPFAYLQFLKHEEEQQKKEVKRISKKGSIAKFRKKIEKNIPESIEVDPAKDFTLQKETRLHQLLHLSDLSDETLHEIRKILKDIMYNRFYVEPYLGDILYLNSIVRIEPLTVKLGEFQDWCISCVFMKSINPEEWGKEKNVLQMLKLLFQQKKEKAQQEITGLLSDIKIQMAQKEEKLSMEIM